MSEQPGAADAAAVTAGSRDDEAVTRFVEQAARVFADWGFPRMASRVLFVMMTADDPGLTAADLARQLGVSPAAISGAVNYLVQLGLVERVPVPGSRRDLHRMRDDAWYVSSARKIGQLYDGLVSLADDGVRALGGPDTTSGARVAEMRDFFQFVAEEIAELMDRWHARRTAQGQA